MTMTTFQSGLFRFAIVFGYDFAARKGIAPRNDADVIVYGSTAWRICSRRSAAAREGASVIFLEPTGHSGAMNNRRG